MDTEQNIALHTAESLLQINAIKINIRNPFTWVSGIRSPIYCDNRQILSYPEIRAEVSSNIGSIVSREFAHCEIIAGVATGAIAHGVLVAERLNKPFIYVRGQAKGHGLSNKIEGKIFPGAKVVVIEDLVSTGNSSIEAVQALRNAGCEVLGMVAIFSYELPQAIIAMEENHCALFTLSNFSSLMKQAGSSGMLSATDIEVLTEWRLNPESFYHGQI